MSIKRLVATLALLVIPMSALAQAFELFADGWVAEVYFQPRGSSGLKFPTALALKPNGDLYVAELGTFDQPTGKVRLIRDADSSGLGDTEWVYASGFTEPTGLALLPNGDLYVSSAGRITRVRDTDGDEVADDYLDIMTGLPCVIPNFSGDHRNHGIAYGPDGYLYTTVGYPNCAEEDPRMGTVRRVSPDGSVDETYATGIRNVYGMAFNASGDLFANDQDSFIAEELNHIRQGEDYGFPAYEGTPPAGTGTVGAIAVLPLPPLGMAFGFGDKLYQASHEGAIWEITLTPQGDTYGASYEQIETGSKPIAMAYDDVNNRMFLVTHSQDAPVVIFGPRPPALPSLSRLALVVLVVVMGAASILRLRWVGP